VLYNIYISRRKNAGKWEINKKISKITYFMEKQCRNCVFWIMAAERTKSLINGVHYKTNLGYCMNPVVRDQIFHVRKGEEQILFLNHKNIEFDESFGCIHQKSNINGSVQEP
jgi:hypothetical protein